MCIINIKVITLTFLMFSKIRFVLPWSTVNYFGADCKLFSRNLEAECFS